MEKKTKLNVIRQILRYYIKSNYSDLTFYVNHLIKTKAYFSIYSYIHITPEIVKYIDLYKLDLLANLIVSDYEYQTYSDLVFKTRPDIVKFLKLTTGLKLKDCYYICYKYKPFNFNQLEDGKETTT